MAAQQGSAEKTSFQQALRTLFGPKGPLFVVTLRPTPHRSLPHRSLLSFADGTAVGYQYAPQTF
jgi:hypothetical protein